jgi:ABC-type transport system involved in cytochrome c biogenesis permease subunit
MNNMVRFLPGVVVAIAGLYLATTALPPQDAPGTMQLSEFSKIPIVERGRVKPIDTLARTSLMIVSGRQTFKDDKGERQPAIKWLMEVLTSRISHTGKTEKYEVFRIENDQLLNMLGLKAKPEFYRYSIEELAPRIEKLQEEATRARKVEPRQRNSFDQKTVELAEHLELYIQLVQWEEMLPVPPASQDQEWQPLFEGLRAWEPFVQALKEKKSFGAAVAQARQAGQPIPPAGALFGLMLAYSQGDVEHFNSQLADYQQQLVGLIPSAVRMAGYETFFNQFAPFYQCTLLYVMVFLLVCFAWLFYPPLRKAAFWLAVLVLVVHTWALVSRMVIQGRPPVTNLYSSAVFIGWAGVILGLILEAIYRNGLGTAAGAVLGSLTLFVAHYLAGSGDTLEMMQAVLDTNFWLATHVTVVNLGYMATFVAGAIGIGYVIVGFFTPYLTREVSRDLTQMIYGVLCFATLLSFTGTVLGGIWADQSWGRFWGWDPKENGALMIVLVNALILHARWAGMVKQRGMAVLSLVGNMVTAWSYFGTNQLGVGLHAYGFNNTLAFGLTVFWCSQIVLIGMGLLPLKWWRSFAPTKETAKETVTALA